MPIFGGFRNWLKRAITRVLSLPLAMDTLGGFVALIAILVIVSPSYALNGEMSHTSSGRNDHLWQSNSRRVRAPASKYAQSRGYWHDHRRQVAFRNVRYLFLASPSSDRRLWHAGHVHSLQCGDFARYVHRRVHCSQRHYHDLNWQHAR